MVRRLRRPPQPAPDRLPQGWKQYKKAHQEWYRAQQGGHAYESHLEFWKMMIYNLLTLSTIPVGCVPPIAPPRPFNRFAWPLAIPFPTGVVPRPLSIAHHQLATATAAPPLTLNLSSTQILAALSPPAQLAAIRVTVLETTCVRQYVRNRLQFAQSRADEIAGRGFASSEVNEARSEEVPKIRPRNVLRSTTQDTLHSFGITPEKDLPSFDTLTGPWSCPGSSDTESSISWVPKRELGNGVNARAILWLKKDGDESSTWVSQQPNTPIIIITTLQRVVTKNLDFAEHWTNRTYWADDDRTTPIEAAIHAAVQREHVSYRL